MAEHLLLVIYAYGTNTGIVAVADGGHGPTEDELCYVCRRYLTAETARQIAIDIADATFARPQYRVVSRAPCGTAPPWTSRPPTRSRMAGRKRVRHHKASALRPLAASQADQQGSGGTRVPFRGRRRRRGRTCCRAVLAVADRLLESVHVGIHHVLAPIEKLLLGVRGKAVDPHQLGERVVLVQRPLAHLRGLEHLLAVELGFRRSAGHGENRVLRQRLLQGEPLRGDHLVEGRDGDCRVARGPA
ncbi:hypothetical protein EAO73_27510 [Streptomyces sp. col6]|nr:hypothetical protein EAO73_27510 [Streptomyces sp. col6]